MAISITQPSKDNNQDYLINLLNMGFRFVNNRIFEKEAIIKTEDLFNFNILGYIDVSKKKNEKANTFYNIYLEFDKLKIDEDKRLATFANYNIVSFNFRIDKEILDYISNNNKYDMLVFKKIVDNLNYQDSRIIKEYDENDILDNQIEQSLNM